MFVIDFCSLFIYNILVLYIYVLYYILHSKCLKPDMEKLKSKNIKENGF